MGFPPLPYLAPLITPDMVAAWQALGAELQRRAAARGFTPGDGLKIVGGPNVQQEYTRMLRREMLRSPKFHALMLEINADKASPVTVRLGWRQRGVFIDDFHSQGEDRFGKFEFPGQQELDLFDFAQLPVEPPADNPNAITQGELLVHAMAEARQGALGHDYHNSHRAGIQAQNDYRDERGQQGHRRMGKEEDGAFNNAGDWSVTYDNGHNEVWMLSERNIKEVKYSEFGPLTSP